MGKNIRRGRTGNVRCASCGQITRRDRAVYLFRNGIKAYYCPDCAKKIHGQRLYKGMPKYVRKTNVKHVKRKFTIFATEDKENAGLPEDINEDIEEREINLSEDKGDQQENNEQ